MSSRSQRTAPASDALVTKCIDEVNVLRNELTALKSNVTHFEDILPSKIRAATTEISQNTKTATQDLKLEFHDAMNKLLDNVKKENAEKVAKFEDKLAGFQSSMNYRIAEQEKAGQKAIEEFETQMNQKFVNLEKTFLNLRGDFKKGDSKLELEINELKGYVENLSGQVQELHGKLINETNERDVVKSDLDNNVKDLSNAIEDLKKYLNEMMKQRDSEIDKLVQRSDGNEKKLLNCDVKADKISQSLQTSNSKGKELSNELDGVQKSISDLGNIINTKFAKISEEFDQKIKVQSNHNSDTLTEIKRDNASHLKALKDSIDELSGQLNGKFAASLESNHALAEEANNKIANLKEQQGNIETKISNIDSALTKKHATAINQINEIRELYNETVLEIQDLRSEMTTIPRVKRQIHEIHNGYRIPQNENGEFENDN